MSRDDSLIAAARAAMAQAYAPYSGFRVGAALRFADGAVITGSNFENASYGLSLCAEAVALGAASHAGRRGGLVGVAVAGGTVTGGSAKPVTPCGRCRQMLHEMAALGGTDPLILATGDREILEIRLSALLPHAFGPATLADRSGTDI